MASLIFVFLGPQRFADHRLAEQLGHLDFGLHRLRDVHLVRSSSSLLESAQGRFGPQARRPGTQTLNSIPIGIDHRRKDLETRSCDSAKENLFLDVGPLISFG